MTFRDCKKMQELYLECAWNYRNYESNQGDNQKDKNKPN